MYISRYWYVLGELNRKQIFQIYAPYKNNLLFSIPKQMVLSVSSAPQFSPNKLKERGRILKATKSVVYLYST